MGSDEHRADVSEDREDASGGTGEPVIKLDQFLKWSGITATGGQAKVLIQSGAVMVNGVIETRRGRQLHQGDRVEVEGRSLTVDMK
jgi:ribosome-associated protein